MNRIGIRALKQNASAVIARASKGEVIEVTDHGRPVARIVPLRENRYDEMVASGQITPPQKDFSDFLAERDRHRAELERRGISTGNTSGLTLQQILDEQREERLP